MDPQRDIDIVLAMVDANNQQADIETSGGPFLVSGVGIFPRTRSELMDRNMWDPYETYTSRSRNKIEVTKIVRYTGILFSDPVQIIKEKLRKGRNDGSLESSEAWIVQPEKLRAMDLSKWVVPDDFHVTLCLGAASQNFLECMEDSDLGSL